MNRIHPRFGVAVRCATEKNMNTVPCRKVIFYSRGDEASFFAFAGGIPAVTKVEGVAESLVLHLRPKVSDASLRDLIALLYRYKIDMRPLAELKTKKNSEWFCDPASYWHKKVFGK